MAQNGFEVNIMKVTKTVDILCISQLLHSIYIITDHTIFILLENQIKIIMTQKAKINI